MGHAICAGSLRGRHDARMKAIAMLHPSPLYDPMCSRARGPWRGRAERAAATHVSVHSSVWVRPAARVYLYNNDFTAAAH